MVLDEQKLRTEGRMDNAKTISLRLRRGIKLVADQLHIPQSILIRSTAPGVESLSPRAGYPHVLVICLCSYIIMIPSTYILLTNFVTALLLSVN